ncbi:MAG: hypothetical protein M5U22_07705 [Thermoleophilia bacterium]|nr:hypothetical protein [Thermoleophilia bacterium]
MTRIDEYRAALTSLTEWEPYLLEHSGLPGPRGNLELARAFAEIGTVPLFLRLAVIGPEEAPTGSQSEFLTFCGTLGLGRLLVEGGTPEADPQALLGLLRRQAGDPRWRVREAAAMALQWWGESDLPALLEVMDSWAEGSLLECRAVVAALCEPSLLLTPPAVEAALRLLDQITTRLVEAADRRSEEVRVLRKALAYGWSVVVAADPERGRPAFELWLACDDADVLWVARQNLAKKRLERADPQWVVACRRALG